MVLVVMLGVGLALGAGLVIAFVMTGVSVRTARGGAIVWSHESGRSVPEGFLYAVFPRESPAEDGADVPGFDRLVPIMHHELVADPATIEFLDREGVPQRIGVDEITFVPPSGRVREMILRYDEARSAWDGGFDWDIVELGVRADRERTVVSLTIRVSTDDDHQADRFQTFRYEVRDGAPVPLEHTRSSGRP